ncbi:MAG: PAS domain S-box protein, partial [Bacteroidota bacterium]
MNQEYRILIAEDVPTDAELEVREVKKVLGNCTFKRVETKEDFLKALDEFKPDLILSDYQMPGFDGLTALKLALEKTPITPLIIVTGSMNEDIAVECMKAGATDYVIKEQIKRLSSAVLNALERKQNKIEKQKALEALIESEERFRRLAENAEDIIYRYEIFPKRMFTYVSPAALKISGYTPEEHYADPDLGFKIVHPDDRHLLKDLSKDTAEIRKPIILRWIRKDGKLIWTEQKNIPIYDDEGNIVAVEGITRDITKRKQAEDALRESELKLRNIFENSSNVFYSHTPDHILTYLSPQIKNVLGYTPEEALRKWTELTSDNPINEEGFRLTVKAIETCQAQPPYELELIHKNGRKVWVEVREAPVVENGKTVQIVGALVDITERKQMEDALRNSEQSYRHIVDFAPIGIYRSSLEGKILSANKTFSQILGYDSPEELLEKNMGEDIYYIKEEREKLIQEFEGAGVALDLERQWKKKDGTPIWIQGNSRAVKDETGKIKYFEGFVRDITERKRAEEALRENEKFLNNIVENIPNMLFVKDAKELRFVRFNKAGEALLGYSKEEMYGKNDYDFFPKEEADFFTEKDRETLLSKKSIDIPEETIRTRYQEERILHTKKIPILDSNGNSLYLLGISEDITERKRAEMLQNSVYQISQAADQATSSEELFKLVHEIIGKVMPAKNLYVALYDEKNDLISYPYYVDEFDTPSPPTKPRRGLTEYVLRTGKPLLCDETADKKLHKLGEIELVGTQSPIWLGVPLKVENKSIGVIVVQHYSDPKAYNEKDMQMLEYVSSQVAHTVERKLKEEELFKAKERAESLEKLKQEFLAQMSHEVRTPLNILLNYSND